MDLIHSAGQPHPAIIRAQVITQNYICFVYFREGWFTGIGKVVSADSVTKKVSCFLTNNPVRRFRNAIAHGNWSYSEDFSSLIYWAKKHDTDEALTQYRVSQLDLDFWQMIIRCTAYASLSAIEGT